MGYIKDLNLALVTLVMAGVMTGVTAGVTARAANVVAVPLRPDAHALPLQRAQQTEVSPEPYRPGVDPSITMLGSVRKVIDSIRSKTALRQDPLEHLQYSGGVRILRFSRLAGEDRVYNITVYGDKSVDQVLMENRDTIIRSRKQLRASPVAMRALDREGFTLDQVMTWETGGTALLAIVVDDRDGAGNAVEQ